LDMLNMCGRLTASFRAHVNIVSLLTYLLTYLLTKDDNDWVKRRITWEVERIRQRGCSKKTWCDCVKNDMESLGLSHNMV